ncbi:MAG: hypothetical protein WKG01_03390 [Kofleriaceae bacterium]
MVGDDEPVAAVGLELAQRHHVAAVGGQELDHGRAQRRDPAAPPAFERHHQRCLGRATRHRPDLGAREQRLELGQRVLRGAALPNVQHDDVAPVLRRHELPVGADDLPQASRLLGHRAQARRAFGGERTDPWRTRRERAVLEIVRQRVDQLGRAPHQVDQQDREQGAEAAHRTRERESQQGVAARVGIARLVDRLGRKSKIRMILEAAPDEAAAVADRDPGRAAGLVELGGEQQHLPAGSGVVAIEHRDDWPEHVDILVAHPRVEADALGCGGRAGRVAEKRRQPREQHVGFARHHPLDVGPDIVVGDERDPRAIGWKIGDRSEVELAPVLGVAVGREDLAQQLVLRRVRIAQGAPQSRLGIRELGVDVDHAFASAMMVCITRSPSNARRPCMTR